MLRQRQVGLLVSACIGVLHHSSLSFGQFGVNTRPGFQESKNKELPMLAENCPGVDHGLLAWSGLYLQKPGQTEQPATDPPGLFPVLTLSCLLAEFLHISLSLTHLK